MIRQKGQLYFDDQETDLNLKEINRMISGEFFEACYPKALEHFLSLTDRIENCLPHDLQWLKMEYTIPYFADLIFRCKEKVYAILFCRIDDNGETDYSISPDLFINACRKNNLVSCFLPFNSNHEVISYTGEKWCLLEASAYLGRNEIKEIVPEKESTGDAIVESSHWELYNTAVMAIVEDLCNKQNLDQVLYQTYEGVDPAVCWIDKDSVFNWMVIRIMKSDDDTVSYPKELLDLIKKNNGLGHYGVCRFTNPYAKDVFPRGQAFDLKFEIDDL